MHFQERLANSAFVLDGFFSWHDTHTVWQLPQTFLVISKKVSRQALTDVQHQRVAPHVLILTH
jgi:hypothetical protein